MSTISGLVRDLNLAATALAQIDTSSILDLAACSEGIFEGVGIDSLLSETAAAQSMLAGIDADLMLKEAAAAQSMWVGTSADALLKQMAAAESIWAGIDVPALSKQMAAAESMWAGIDVPALSKQMVAAESMWVGMDASSLLRHAAWISPDLGERMDRTRESETQTDNITRSRATRALLGAFYTLATDVEELSARTGILPLTHAARSLRKAADTFAMAEGDHDHPQVIRDAVGALEEIARQRVNQPKKTLPKVLILLRALGAIDEAAHQGMTKAYVERSRIPGAAHGAGECPEYIAQFVLYRVKEGVIVLLDGWPDSRWEPQ